MGGYGKLGLVIETDNTAEMIHKNMEASAETLNRTVCEKRR